MSIHRPPPIPAPVPDDLRPLPQALKDFINEKAPPGAQAGMLSHPCDTVGCIDHSETYSTHLENDERA